MTENRRVPIGDDEVATDERIEVHAPYDGELIGTVPSCDASHVDKAVAAARSVMTEGPPAWRRAEILDAAAVEVRDRQDDLARTIAVEAAKPMRTARTEAARCVDTLRFAAAEARTLTGEMVPMEGSAPGEGKLGFTLREPIGVVGAITPFNFPLNLVAHKLAPAIAAGCPVVLKPASQTPFSALALVDVLREAGLPAGWINVVTGSGSTVGNPIVDHDGIAMITFTGSPDVGWGIRARAPRKKVSLELGNNSPLLIQPSGDWKAAAAKVKTAGFSHAGQSCISTQRVLVHRDIHDEFVAELVDAVGELRLGDPLSEETDVSSLIAPEETERVATWVGEATEAGARVVAGGSTQGRLLEPTVLTGTTEAMRVCHTEVFGPVVAVAAYDDLDEGIARANNTRYGLQAAIYTSDLDEALTAARILRFGGVLVNEVPTFRADQQPYGGEGESGNTREGPRHAVREMTTERLVIFS